MLNGDLIVAGKRVDETDIFAFQTAEDMTYWELGRVEWDEANTSPIVTAQSIYVVYDAKFGPQEEGKADTVSQIFGEEWGNRFIAHKNMLIDKETIADYKDQIKTINMEINEIQRRIDVYMVKLARKEL